MSELSILFLGGVFTKDMEEDIQLQSNTMIQYAANKLQWNIINGFMERPSVKISILSAPFIGPYPVGYKKNLIKDVETIYKKKVHFKSVKFMNLWAVRNISRKLSLKKNIENFALLNIEESKAILIYSAHTPLIEAAIYAKTINPRIHLCLLLPDLPQYMNLSVQRSIVYKLLKKIDIRLFEKSLTQIDSFVLLTDHMRKKLAITNRPYLIIEGMVNSEVSKIQMKETKSNNFPSSKVLSIAYTGTLNKRYGVLNLIEAFQMIHDDNVSLVICGKGDSEQKVHEAQKVDKRIKYLGQLSNDEAHKLQHSADILVNPRQNNEEYTKYSFPSKILEYMATGRPVIAYKLDGMPDEYDKYLYYVENNEIESFASKIREVIALTDSERNSKGIAAANFVYKEKNNVVMSLKILDMIVSTARDT